MENWTPIEPGVWKPLYKGDQIEGILVNKEPRNEKTGISARYYVKAATGTYLVWGSAVIEDRMQFVEIGQKVRITFDGKTKNKRNQEVNLFKIEVARLEEKVMD